MKKHLAIFLLFSILMICSKKTNANEFINSTIASAKSWIQAQKLYSKEHGVNIYDEASLLERYNKLKHDGELAKAVANLFVAEENFPLTTPSLDSYRDAVAKTKKYLEKRDFFLFNYYLNKSMYLAFICSEEEDAKSKYPFLTDSKENQEEDWQRNWIDFQFEMIKKAVRTDAFTDVDEIIKQQTYLVDAQFLIYCKLVFLSYAYKYSGHDADFDKDIEEYADNIDSLFEWWGKAGLKLRNTAVY